MVKTMKTRPGMRWWGWRSILNPRLPPLPLRIKPSTATIRCDTLPPCLPLPVPPALKPNTQSFLSSYAQGSSWKGVGDV